MKRFVLHSETQIDNINTYRDYFGDYLFKGTDNFDSIINALRENQVFKRDIFHKDLASVLKQEKDTVFNKDTLIVNAFSIEYLVFKDRFLIKNNPHLILDGISYLAKILKISNIDIILRSYYRKEKEILIQALADAEDLFYLDTYFKINIYDKTNYNKKIDITFFENNEYVFDLETITQFAYIAHMGSNNFHNYGRSNYKGSFIVSISGDILLPNLYEFESGVSFKDIVRISGNLPKEYSIKCVFLNGFLSPPISIDDLLSLSLNSGEINLFNGGLCFIEESRCMLRVVLKILNYAKVLTTNVCLISFNGFDLCEFYINRILIGKSQKKDYLNLVNTLKTIIKLTPSVYIKAQANCILSTIEMFGYEFVYAIDNKVPMYSFVR